MAPGGNGSVTTNAEHAHRIVKRSSQNQNLNFEVKSPNVDWTKVVGTTDIGASFGVTMKNKLKYNTGMMSAWKENRSFEPRSICEITNIDLRLACNDIENDEKVSAKYKNKTFCFVFMRQANN